MMILIPFIGIHCIYDCILLGLANGVFTEGASRWGFDPVWLDIEIERNVEMVKKL